MATEFCYANPNPVFQPAMRIISAITNANPALVTTSFAHNYKTGMIVRINIPPTPINGYSAGGMTQINQLYAPIVVRSPTTFNIDINTLNFDTFSVPSVSPGPPAALYTCANCVPIGEISATLAAATVNVLPTGVF